MALQAAVQDGVLSVRELINPHERQIEFLRAIYTHRFVLYGGSRGGGKSYILRWALFHYLMWCTSQGHRNVRVGLFCITYNELWNRQIVKVIAEFPETFGTYNGEHEEFRFHERYGGHVIQFCNMANLTSYQSAEFAAIAVDEVTLCPDWYEVFNFLVGSLRWPGIRWTPLFGATNPTGPGHSAVKNMFITKDFTDPRIKNRASRKDQFHYIPALPRDNPHLTEEYIQENLEGLPDHLREPWLNGSWDIVAGQRFPTFRDHVHVIDPCDLEAFGPTEYYQCIDYGTYDPMCCGTYAITNVEPQHRRWEGERIRATKIHEHLETGLSSSLQAQRCRELREIKGWPIKWAYLDTQAWGEYEEGLSIADKFMGELGVVLQVLKDRVAGWDALDNLLRWKCFRDEKGIENHSQVIEWPTLQFFSTCPATIGQIRDAMWDPRKGNDIIETRAGGGHQDALHETRYFALTHLRPPAHVRVDSHLEHTKQVWAIMQNSKKSSSRALRTARKSVYRRR